MRARCSIWLLASLLFAGQVFAQGANNRPTFLPYLNIGPGPGGVQATITTYDIGNANSYTTPAWYYFATEGYPSFPSTSTHFGLVVQNTKNAASATTTGSRQAMTVQQLGVGGTASDYFTGGLELMQPCLAPVVCNGFNLSGNFTANSPYVYIPAGMTPTTVVGEEIDATLLSPGAAEREGLRIADLGSTQQGTIDAAINVAANGVGWKTFLYAGDNTGTFALSAGGTFLSTPVSSVVLNSLLDFRNLSGAPTLGGIVLGANVGQSICFAIAGGGTCAGGTMQSATITNGGIIYFLNGSIDLQQGGVNSLIVYPTSVAISVPLTVSAGGAAITGDVSTTTHFNNSSAVPTISACGTSPPAATAGSNNSAGQFTLGTGTTAACTVTFATAYPNTAWCTVTPAGAVVLPTTTNYRISAQTKSAFTITLSTGLASVVFNYTCGGN